MVRYHAMASFFLAQTFYIFHKFQSAWRSSIRVHTVAVQIFCPDNLCTLNNTYKTLFQDIMTLDKSTCTDLCYRNVSYSLTRWCAFDTWFAPVFVTGLPNKAMWFGGNMDMIVFMYIAIFIILEPAYYFIYINIMNIPISQFYNLQYTCTSDDYLACVS